MDVEAESCKINKWTAPRNSRGIPLSTRFSLIMKLSRLTRDRTAELVSLGQILRRKQGQGNIHFSCSADFEQDRQTYLVDHYSCYIVTIRTYIHTYICQTRACGFEAELKAAKGKGLSVGADVFDGSSVDPVRLRNEHVAWMTLINNCRGRTLEIVQHSEAPNDAWQNLESHYKAKTTREILRLLHEVNGKTMLPGEDPFQFMMEIDRLAVNLNRLGDRTVAEVSKWVIIVAVLSADYEIEVSMLEKNPTGLES